MKLNAAVCPRRFVTPADNRGSPAERVSILTTLAQELATAAKDYVRAIDVYREILRIAPTDTEAALWLARLYRLQNEHDKAEAVLREYLRGDPEEEEALEQLTQLLLDEGRTDEAIALLEKAVERGPTAGLWGLLGGAYAQTHQYAQAESAYRHAQEMEPGDANVARGLAQALSAQMKDDEALESYRRLAKLEPEDA